VSLKHINLIEANATRKNQEKFCWKIKWKLNIIIILHFSYIYDILQPEGFCDAENAPNSFYAGASPRTQLGELMALPRVPSRLGRGIPFSHSPSR